MPVAEFRLLLSFTVAIGLFMGQRRLRGVPNTPVMIGVHFLLGAAVLEVLAAGLHSTPGGYFGRRRVRLLDLAVRRIGALFRHRGRAHAPASVTGPAVAAGRSRGGCGHGTGLSPRAIRQIGVSAANRDPALRARD